MSETLRIGHVIHSLGPGGAENVLVDLADAATSAGLEIVVVGLSPVSDPVHARTLRSMGVTVAELDMGRWDVRAVPRTVALLRRHGVAVVHSHLKHADLVGAVAAARLGLPLVSTLHLIEDGPVGVVGRMKRSAGLFARRRLAARTIALSRSQLRWYEELAGSTQGLVVLPNGVRDPGPPAPGRREHARAGLGVPSDGLLVASASLMRPEKGHDLLLDAIRLLADAPGLTVALGGDGPLREHLEQRVAADERLRGRVRFLGYVHDVPELLRAADLVLHTSLADALPTALMHALAVGTPVVATRVGGIPDIVTPDVGTLVATDPVQIADAVRALAADPAVRAAMSSAARARFLQRFEATGWAQRLRGVYEQVLQERDLPGSPIR